MTAEIESATLAGAGGANEALGDVGPAVVAAVKAEMGRN